ncbi:LPS export ABC transporter permease LptG [Pleionea sediminis]|uniref:LPS export ABC transporter permease LptG n=1 Tax=Pleionea sediminis TaxID=2569479 RepID=UPI0011856AAE|nr:LPS export ABC transporter permease LptG [Pleionea sediminis]
MIRLTRLDKYIGRQVLFSVLFTALILIGLRTLFTLLDEAGKIGQGDYHFVDALYYSLLLIPARLYEFFPMSVLIGGLSALGVLAAQNELTVMRSIGIRTITIVGSAVKVTIVLMLFVFIVGEWLSPVASSKAQQGRAASLSGNHLQASGRGIWARSGNDILHMKGVISDKKLREVTLFRLDNNAHLISQVFASDVIYKGEQWVFQNAVIKTPKEDRIEQQQIPQYVWNGDLEPKHVDVLTVEPEVLNLRGLLDYQVYLDENQLDSRRYQLEFWRKIAQPFSLIVMIVLASSFIFGPMRSVSMGARLMTGIVVGFTFHIFNNFFGPISLVYKFPPIMGAIMPILIFAILSGYLLKRAK